MMDGLGDCQAGKDCSVVASLRLTNQSSLHVIINLSATINANIGLRHASK